jgi:Holliday junction resolvase RusA-like endonuclease
MMDAIAPCAEVVLDLPYPPSVNKIWKSTAAISARRICLSPSYQEWKKAADLLLFTGGRGWRAVRITGPFVAEIGLCAPKGYPRGDLDNRIKAVLDYAQRIEIVSNDKHCQRLVVEWVEEDTAPHGCRLTLRPCT